MDDMDDMEHMRRALAQAANPWVGCVIVPPGSAADDGAVFAGATAPPGGAHAEAAALLEAGEAARGATLYVTLEPCAHQGRTPPCTDAIIEAGVARVVVGIEDPDERVAGRGRGARRGGRPAGPRPRPGRAACCRPGGHRGRGGR
jgi:diaminohydroxyphosphoribosylaminopyrimidine deaminase/5-amino-6-(5-phosphoribosylamino)uracil reductase